MKLIVYTDGACRGNPGPAGCGYIIMDASRNLLKEGALPIGTATNNIAEYMALLFAARDMKEYEPVEVDFYLDSQLVVRQMTGEYKVRDKKLAEIKKDIEAELTGTKVRFHHIPRNENKEADRLANQALDDF